MGFVDSINEATAFNIFYRKVSCSDEWLKVSGGVLVVNHCLKKSHQQRKVLHPHIITLPTLNKRKQAQRETQME